MLRKFLELSALLIFAHAHCGLVDLVKTEAISALLIDGSGKSDAARPKRGLTKRSSTSNILSDRTTFESMNVSRVNAFRATVDRHCELANRILLTSKEIAERRGQVDVAFRACRDAFLEVSTVLVNFVNSCE